MPELLDIRDALPSQIIDRLLVGEPAYFYSVGKGGCLSGEKEWFSLTDRRVLMTTKEDNRRGTVDIPVEQIASVSSVVETGCLSGGRGVLVVTSTGGTHNQAVVASTDEADRGTAFVQEVLSRRRDEGRRR